MKEDNELYLQQQLKDELELGMNYLIGRGVRQDISRAIKIFEKADKAEVDLPADAYRRIGKYYDDNKDFAQSAYWCQRAADRGYLDAQFNMGVCYENGEGVERDFKKAEQWYRKAADQGYLDAQYRLGVCCYYGFLGVEDKGEAISWLRKAADDGHQNAKAKLRELRDIDEEKLTADDQKLAENGDAGACYRLGVGYRNGTIGSQGVDAKKAVSLFRKAADQGHPAAQYNLGVCYCEGSGVEKNEEEAVKWILKSGKSNSLLEGILLNLAKKDDSTACLKLGMMYLQGGGAKGGIKKDEVLAGRWIRRAAELGNEHASHCLQRNPHLNSLPEASSPPKVGDEAKNTQTLPTVSSVAPQLMFPPPPSSPPPPNIPSPRPSPRAPEAKSDKHNDRKFSCIIL